MDFFQRNMDNIKGKLPNVPKLPKLKTRKIFTTSRDNISSQYEDSSQMKNSSLQLTSPSGNVNLTPSRIGTISSLVDGAEQSNFNIPDEFVGRSPMGGRRRIRFSDSNLKDIGQFGVDNRQQQQHPQSANSFGSVGSTSKTRFTEKLTKQYKELSEFKLSHLFGKKTVVRKTEIEVNTYLQGIQQNDGIDNHMYRHDEPSFGSGMDIDNRDMANRKRRISEVSNFNVDIKTLPSGSQPSPLPKPKAALKMPPLPMTPENLPSLNPSTERQVLKGNLKTSDETPITAPLAKRKVYTPEDPDSLDNDFESIQNSGIFLQKSGLMERQSSTKSHKSISSNPGSLRSRPGSQKSRGMWELKRPIRIKASPEDYKKTTDSHTTDSSTDFRKTLSNVLKKFHSPNVPADENEEPPPPKPSTFKKIQQSVRNRTKSEPKSQSSDAEDESEFKKQFNKIRNRTGKLQSLIKHDTENSSATTYAKSASTEEGPTTEESEDPEKSKSLDEIEKLGYGRKNLKYIEKWRIRRRRELRRNEPFPTSKSDDSEGEAKDHESNMDHQKDTSEASQLTELKKSLAKVLKKRNLAREVSTDSATGDELQSEEPHQQSTRRGFGSLFKKQTFRTSVSVEENLDQNSGAETADQKTAENPEQKVPFWKKRSVKSKISTEDLTKSSDNLTSDGEGVEQNLESHKKISLLNKAKNKVEKLKAMKKPSIDTVEGNKNAVGKTEKLYDSPINKQYLEGLDNVDEETARAIEEMERNSTNFKPKPTATWQTTKLITEGVYSSSSEESVTTPGFLTHENAPDSDTYVRSEPTVIILSGPMPALMTLPSKVPSDLRHLYPTLNLEIEEDPSKLVRPSSPTPFQNMPNVETLSTSDTSPTRSQSPLKTLKEFNKILETPLPSNQIPDLFERPRSTSPVLYKTSDELIDSPTGPKSNLKKLAGFHDLTTASLSSSFESPIMERRDYQLFTQPQSLSPTHFENCESPLFRCKEKETPPPLPSCSPPPLLEVARKIYPDLPSEFEEALGLTSEMLESHKFNFKSDTLQIILESPNSGTNSLNEIEFSSQSPTTPPFCTPIQSPPTIPKRMTPNPNDSPIPKIGSPIGKIRSQNENQKIENNSSVIPRPRHSRKPSMDKPPPIETRSPIIGVNKIEKKYEPCIEEGTEIVKKWSSIDIFNGNDEAFTDFDEVLKNVPIIPIQIEKNDELLNIKENTREYKSMSPSLEKSSHLLIDENKTLSSDDDELDEEKIPTGVPVVPERPKPGRPVVKQASMRRQFSDEKDAADLNKNIDVNKLRSKFESSNAPPRPPERMSFRKYEKVEVTTVIESNNNNNNNNINNNDSNDTNNNKNDIIDDTTKPKTEFIITKTTIPPEKIITKESSPPPPLLPRKARLIKQPTSLEVETDGSDGSTDVYEPIEDFVGNSQKKQQEQQNNNRKEAIPVTDMQLTSTSTLKAIQAKQQYEANLKPKVDKLQTKDENLQSLQSSTSSTSSSAASTLSIIVQPTAPATIITENLNETNNNKDIIIGKSSTAKILQHQQQHQLKQEQQKQKEILHKTQMSPSSIKQIEKDINTDLVSRPVPMSKTISNVAINNNKQPPQSIDLVTKTEKIIKTNTITNIKSDIQPDGNTSSASVISDEGYSFNNEKIKISDLKKDEMFYSLDDEEYQQYSLSGPTIVKELYTIEI